MVVAPLMGPIISLSMAMARQDEALFVPSSKKLLAGVAVSLFCSCWLTYLLPLELITEEIEARTKPNLLDLAVAIISGIAGAYAHARVSAAKGLAGVAIAVALVPPLAVTGIGIGWLNLTVAAGAFLLFITNLAGMVFAGALTYLALGFAPFKRAQRGLVISLVSVIAVSIPLYFSFEKLVSQIDIRNQLLQLKVDELILKEVEVVSVEEPIEIKLDVVNHQPLQQEQLNRLKREIEYMLSQPVRLEVRYSLRY